MKASKKVRAARAPRGKRQHGSLYRRTRPPVRMGRFFGTALLLYLLHVSVTPYIRVQNVAPNLLLAAGAIYAVGYPSRLRAFWIGSMYGILTETMSQTVDLMNLIMYPVLITFFAFLFGDPSDERLEAMRRRNRPNAGAGVVMRTVGCAAVMSVFYEIVNAGYVYLRGIDLTAGHIQRALISIVYTTAVTLILFLPVRALLGIPLPKRRVREVRGRYVV